LNKQVEFSEFYSTPQHVGWFTILYVEALNIFNLIDPVHYRFRQIFKNAQIYGVLVVKYTTGERNAYEKLYGKKTHNLNNIMHGGI
jgi:hypothetical protein